MGSQGDVAEEARRAQARVPATVVGRRGTLEDERVDGGGGSHALLGLQRRVGNRATLEFLRRSQARLEVGAADDPFEVEAEQVAQRVLARLEADPSGPPAGPSVQRLVTDTARRSSGGEGAVIGRAGGQVDGHTDAAIASERGGGRALTTEVRSSMESAFGGVDFSSVRLHTGTGAATLSRQLSAQAFTVGSDIFFRDGAPDSSRGGQALLAHELTHTIQQSGATSGQVHRLFGKKQAQKPTTPPITPFLAQQISLAISTHPKMQEAESLRMMGSEDEALAILEGFWDKASVSVKDEKGKSRQVRLCQFKALMFTPSERRVLKVRKWRTAVAVKDMWDTAVRKGEVHDPSPVKEGSDSHDAVDTVGGIVDDIGSANTVGEGGAGLAKAFSKSPNSSSSGGGGSGLTKLKSEVASEWAKETSTHNITDKTSSDYEASKYSNNSEWAGGIMGIIGQSLSLVSGVVKTISLALDKRASKPEVAAQIQQNLSSAALTAQTIAQAVENIRGSELTTNMFHWVPGLSIFSNGFAAIGGLVNLIMRSCRIYRLNTERSKTTEAEREDLALAMKRVWVRAAQQVEQDSFAVAKSLVNTALSIAEVATGGAFGIPALGKVLNSAVSGVHSLGHAIADSVRAGATKDARNNYFGAKLAGSAERLIRTDPLAAAEAIISRAGEGDKNARELLDVYGIKVPGLNAPQQVAVTSDNGAGKAPNMEKTLDYSPADVVVYKAALNKLMYALAEKEEPETMWDKIKGAVKSAKAAPGEMRDRYRQAKRIGEVRNEQNYGGKSNRTGAWAFKQAVFGGDAGVKKLSETTAERINTAFSEHKAKEVKEHKREQLPHRPFLPFGSATEEHDKAGKEHEAKKDLTVKKIFVVSDKEVQGRLLEHIQPEALVRQRSKQAHEEKSRKPIEVVDPTMMPTWKAAMAMGFGELYGLVHGRREQTEYSPEEWKVVIAAYAERLSENARLAGYGPK